VKQGTFKGASVSYTTNPLFSVTAGDKGIRTTQEKSMDTHRGWGDCLYVVDSCWTAKQTNLCGERGLQSWLALLAFNWLNEGLKQHRSLSNHTHQLTP